MGLFGSYVYKNQKKEKYFLHSKQKGKTTIYFFSRDPVGALSGLPKGYEVIENKNTFLPMLKKMQKEKKQDEKQG